MKGNLTRRRVLLAGATGLAAGVAGCNDENDGTLPGNPDISTPPTGTDDGDENPPVDAPDTPAATFGRGDGSYRFDFEDLIRYQGWDWHDSSSEHYLHPDSRLFRVEVNADAIHLTLENAHVKRDLDVRVEFNVAAGGTRTTETKTISTTDDFTNPDLSFDIGEYDLPELATGYVRPIADDSHEGATATRLLKVHRYLAIPYDNADGGGVHYLNSDAGLNHQAYYHTDRELVVNHPPPEQARDEIETGQDRTIFLAALHGNKAIGGATTIQKSDLQRYGGFRSRPQDLTPPAVVYNAPDLERFSSFARQLGESMDNAGINSHFGKLTALAAIVQSIPYQATNHSGDSPLITITQNHAECTEVTYIYMALAKCQPFNTRTATISCDLGSLGLHRVVGIDERDLGNPSNPEEMSFVEPGDGEFGDIQNQSCLPNTRYAYLELTADYPIGRTSESLQTIRFIRGTSDLSCSPDLR